MIGQPPPFALDTPAFRFRALASHAGRAALGGDRELALACLMAARMGTGLVPPRSSAPLDLRTRAGAAKQWLASMLLPATVRNLVNSTINAAGDGDADGVARGLSQLLSIVSAQLDEASLSEVRELIKELKVESSEVEAG